MITLGVQGEQNFSLVDLGEFCESAARQRVSVRLIHYISATFEAARIMDYSMRINIKLTFTILMTTIKLQGCNDCVINSFNEYLYYELIKY